MARQTSFRRQTKSRSNSLPMMRRRLIMASALVVVLLAGATAALASITFVMKWGTSGTADGQFITPTGIATDSAGNVYVCDGFNRAQKFTSTGTFLLSLGALGDIPGGFVSTSGVAVDSSGNIYVSDSFTDKISKFNSAGTFVLQWGGSGSAAGRFLGASGVAVDSSGNVYASDTNNHRIQKFTSAGGFITSWGSSGSGDGQFLGPHGVGADATGNVFVADTGNSRLQRFSATGAFIEALGTAGTGDGEFGGPQDVAPDLFGNIFVADTGNDRVQKFSTAATVVANAGSDQTVECAGALTSVTLDGTASTGSGTLTYTWKEGATVLGSGATLTVSLPSGPHTITLTVSSSGGGSDDDDVLITVVDTVAPIITLHGSNPMTVECHTGFADPGANANDGCAGDLTSAITVSGSVNPNVVGTYSLTYMVSDGSHTTSATRTVNVVDTTPPTITCPASIVVGNDANQCSATVNPGTATAADNCSVPSIVGTRSDSQPLNAPYPIGITIITWTATDAAGQTANCQQTVTVKDTQNPTVAFTVTRQHGEHGEDDDNLIRITFSATDNCPGVTVSAVINIGCRRVPISNGQVVSVECGDDECKTKVDKKGRLKIEARTAVLEVTATDSAGNKTTKTQLLCRRGHDD